MSACTGNICVPIEFIVLFTSICCSSRIPLYNSIIIVLQGSRGVLYASHPWTWRRNSHNYMRPQSKHTHTKIHLANEAINIIYQLPRFCGPYHDVKITRWSPSGPAQLAILRPTSRNSRHAVSTRSVFAIRLSTLLSLPPFTIPLGVNTWFHCSLTVVVVTFAVFVVKRQIRM